MRSLILLLAFIPVIFAHSVEGDTKTKYNGKTIKIAIIDTGYNFLAKWNNLDHGLKTPKICNFGHKDFTGEGITDNHGHGTHIAGLIAKYAENANYCIIIIKFYRASGSGLDNLTNSKKALKYALNIKVDMINYSAGGPSFDLVESGIVNKLLSRGTKLVFAAGNDGKNIDIVENRYYPASYSDDIIVVGNMNSNGTRASSSNWGKSVDFWECGINVISLTPKNSTGLMSGTSQATAIRSGKIIKKWYQK